MGVSEAAWGGERHASAIRTTALLIWLVTVASTSYDNYHLVPNAMISPHGLGRLLFPTGWGAAGLWPPPALMIVKWVTVAACVAALFLPVSGRLTMPVACIGVLVLDSATKSLGTFVSHGQVAALHVLILFTIFSDLAYRPVRLVASRTFTPSGEKEYRVVVMLAATVLAVPYVYIGLHRILRGGLELFMGNALLWYLSGTSRGFHAYDGFDPSNYRTVANAGFFIVTLLEIGAVFVMYSTRFRLAWLLAMSASHLAIAVFMNILFWENVLLLWATFWWRWVGDPYRSRT